MHRAERASKAREWLVADAERRDRPADSRRTLLLDVATVHGDQTSPLPIRIPTRRDLDDCRRPGSTAPAAAHAGSARSCRTAGVIRSAANEGNVAVLGTRLSLHKRATPKIVHAGAKVVFALRVRNVAEGSALNTRRLALREITAAIINLARQVRTSQRPDRLRVLLGTQVVPAMVPAQTIRLQIMAGAGSSHTAPPMPRY